MKCYCDSSIKKKPELIGIPLKTLRHQVAAQASYGMFAAVVKLLVQTGRLVERNAYILLNEHAQTLAHKDAKLMQIILPLLKRSGFSPPWLRDLSKEIGIAESALRLILLRAASVYEVFQVVPDLFYHCDSMHQLAQIALKIAQSNQQSSVAQQSGYVEAAIFRDATQLGRKRAIQILEFFDRIGFTQRVDDRHWIHRPQFFEH